MPSAVLATYETEYDDIRYQIINQILNIKLGLRRKLNHDLKNVANEQDAIVRHFLWKDDYYQLMERRARISKCYESALEAASRKCIFENVIFDLCESGDLYYTAHPNGQGIWSLKVSATDRHRRAGQHRRKTPSAFNDASYHGRPRRDRRRPLGHVA